MEKGGRGRGESKIKLAGLNSKLSYKTASIGHAETHYNAGGTEPALPTADRWPLDKYQLLFVVNLVKLHLTAFNDLNSLTMQFLSVGLCQQTNKQRMTTFFTQKQETKRIQMIIKMVTDLCMWVDLPLDKKIVQNQDWATGP